MCPLWSGLSRGERAYAAAKAEVDAVIAGLTVVLAERGTPPDLADLEARLTRGVQAREAFCREVIAITPDDPGTRNPLVALLGAVLPPLLEAARTLYTGTTAQDRLRRQTIQTQLSLALLLALYVSAAAAAAAAGEAGLYDQPILTLDPGMHTAMITHADVSATGDYAVSGSYDKTVRIWETPTGRLLRTIRLPPGAGACGQGLRRRDQPGRGACSGGWVSQ